jgi:hypothetical protein
MSKGLGKLQRDILASLNSPRTEVEKGIYDLRRVARFVAKPRVTAVYGGPEDDKFACPYEPFPAFSAAFSRAIRALIKRGELEEVSRAHRWGGRLSRQIRFVRRADVKRGQ